MIHDNPLLGPEWEPLGHVITHLLDLKKAGAYFELQTYGVRYQLSPYKSPYIQGYYLESGQFLAELSGNLQVDPQLSKDQYLMLQFYGWMPPAQTPDDYKDFDLLEGLENNSPNFKRVFDANQDTLFIAEALLTSLIGVMAITVEDYFGFERNDDAERVEALHKLGRLKKSEGNPRQVIFAMPGRHANLVEVART